MRLLSIVLVLGAAFAMNSCSKGTVTPTDPTTTQKMYFSVNNLVDVNVKQYIDTTFYVAPAVGFISGEQESITLTPTGLPAGVTVTPSSISGTPSFGGLFTFHAHMATTGSFPVKIVATTTSGTTKDFSFNVVAVPNSNCGASVAGNYSVQTVSSPVFSASAEASPMNAAVTTTSTDNVVIIPTIYAGFTAHLNCSAGTLTFDGYHTSDFDISAGTGTYTDHKIILNYTLTQSPFSSSPGLAHSVTATLTR